MIRGGIEDGRIGTWISPNLQNFILRNVNAGREWIAAIEDTSARIRGSVGQPVDWSTEGPEVADNGSVYAKLVKGESQMGVMSHVGAGVGVGRHSTEVEDPNGWKPCTLGETQPAVQQDDGKMKMSSREIAELTGKRHDNVMRDIRSMLDQMDPTSDLSYQQNQGVTSIDCPQTKRTQGFLLDRYHTEVLITGYDVKRRAAVIKRWYDLESGAATPQHQQVQQPALPDFTNPAEAARAWAQEFEGREQAQLEAQRAEQQALEYKGQSEQYQKQIETQTPWVEFARTVSETGDNMMVREAAKALNVKPSKLFQHLKDWGWINSKRVPYQRHIDAGYLEYRVHNYTKPSGDVATTYVPLITGKGLGRLHKTRKARTKNPLARPLVSLPLGTNYQ
ncbi:phage antirepressor KilAC domain-containing protein [Kushneria phyllosphaerae]|uniref:Antirepressor protein C-terminal domain-containing protein n=1 Tax=Kushneria phyllosphaerae TaxID=2100822 RepID=A0A2R8CIF4_9GAMM|nr:phage regulatory protein/antirepressor Ant [Kushneria phyllosphaerae]SPJ32689.1 hypothetical protein KSP9073_00690 [Kushneria phyllosphaerae]